jgi:glycosyltransferase involved in cell wall biosynthesis
VVKHVVFAVPGSLDTPTGGYAYDRRIMAELRQLGWDVECLDIGEGFPSPDEATRSAARSLLLKVPDGQPIVVDGLALGVLPDVVAEVASRHPVLGLVHHPLALEWGLSAERADALHRSEQAALALVREVVVTSPTTAKLVASDYGVSAEHITVARPGSDPAPRSSGSRSEVPHLLSVGAVVPRKGFDVLVAALATLAELPWRLTIAGDLTRDPNEAARLDVSISQHKLTARIAALGAVSSERLAALYDDADLFVLASRFEGYGMAYAEALSHGLPVIGTTAAAIPDTVPQEAGLLVASGDVDALAQALRRVIADADLRRRLSDAALAAAQTLPTWQQSGAIFAAALDKLA